MKLLTLFIQKTEFLGLAIQELLSLFQLYGIPTSQLFPHDPHLSPQQYPYLSPADFSTFPYVSVNVPDDKLPCLRAVIDRSVSISNFVKILAHGATKDEFMADLSSKASLIDQEVEDLSPFAFDIKSHLRKYSPEDKAKLLAELNMPAFKAKGDLKSPQRIFYLIEDYGPGQALKHKYLVKDLFTVRKHRPTATKFRLADRIFLGPTSTDAELSFLMANQGLVSKGKIVYDPFFGTGSIMVAASYLGGFCVGCDIDIRVLQGYGVGRLNKNSSYFPSLKPEDKVNVFLNFKQYGLELPEIVRTDSASLLFLCDNLFDAIVCDPPYGIRAAPKQAGSKYGKGNEELVGEDNYCIPTKKSTCYEITDKLFELGKRSLKSGGRLVFLFPVFSDADPMERFKDVSGYKLIAVSKNRLNNVTYARYLFTFEKI